LAANGSSTESFPAVNLIIPNTVQTGDYVGGWYGRYAYNQGWGSGNMAFNFNVCTDSGQVFSDGTASKLIPVGARAPGVNPAPLGFTSPDGYSVYTTPNLQTAGLGFVVRWKASNRWGEEGDWVSPSGVWSGEVFEQSKGLPFYRWTVTWGDGGAWPGFIQGSSAPTNVFNSLSDWNLVMETYPNPPYLGFGGGYFGIYYDAWVEVRYVAIGPSLQKYVPNDHTVSVNIVRMLAMPERRLNASGRLMQQSVYVKRMPHGTCQTPFHQNIIVGLQADAQDLYANTVSSTPTHFDLNLLDCPLVDVGFSFRAPPGIDILNAAQGVIGLDSTATAQGVGVQVRHRGGWFNDAPIKFNQPGDPDGESPVYWRSNSDGVDSGLGGKNHIIPLTAAVYRTAPVIIPGSIRASLIVLIQHK